MEWWQQNFDLLVSEVIQKLSLCQERYQVGPWWPLCQYGLNTQEDDASGSTAGGMIQEVHLHSLNVFHSIQNNLKKIADVMHNYVKSLKLCHVQRQGRKSSTLISKSALSTSTQLRVFKKRGSCFHRPYDHYYRRASQQSHASLPASTLLKRVFRPSTWQCLRTTLQFWLLGPVSLYPVSSLFPPLAFSCVVRACSKHLVTSLLRSSDWNV